MKIINQYSLKKQKTELRNSEIELFSFNLNSKETIEKKLMIYS
jgi:hypothetical protein